MNKSFIFLIQKDGSQISSSVFHTKVLTALTKPISFLQVEFWKQIIDIKCELLRKFQRFGSPKSQNLKNFQESSRNKIIVDLIFDMFFFYKNRTHGQRI